MTILFSKHHVVLLIVVAVSAGCGAPTANYSMIPVEGTITFEGEPLSNAEVMFDSPDGPRGFGVTDENGMFSVKTRQFGAGLPAGKYRVLVTSSEKTRIRGAGKPVTLATSYRESGVARVSIEAGMQPFAFDLTAKPSKGGNAAGDGDGA